MTKKKAQANPRTYIAVSLISPIRAFGRSPQLTNRLLFFAMEALFEISGIRHGPQDPRPLGRMRIGIDPLNGRLGSGLPAPPIGIRHEEQLLLREKVEAR